MKPLAARFWEKVYMCPMSGCWLWTAHVGGTGYGYLARCDGSDSPEAAHRVSWAIHHGDPGSAWVLHRCDNRVCVNPAHLFLGNATTNAADMAAKGRASRGMHRMHVAKLTDDDVRRIRVDPRRQREIAAQYGVAGSAVSNVKTGRTWRHVV